MNAFEFAVVVLLSMMATSCTYTQEAISGGAVGAGAGFAIAGPVGAGVGAAAGAIATPLVTPGNWRMMRLLAIVAMALTLTACTPSHTPLSDALSSGNVVIKRTGHLAIWGLTKGHAAGLRVTRCRHFREAIVMSKGAHPERKLLADFDLIATILGQIHLQKGGLIISGHRSLSWLQLKTKGQNPETGALSLLTDSGSLFTRTSSLL
jgi:hypothetical protein